MFTFGWLDNFCFFFAQIYAALSCVVWYLNLVNSFPNPAPFCLICWPHTTICAALSPLSFYPHHSGSKVCIRPPDALLPNSDWSTFSSVQVSCVDDKKDLKSQMYMRLHGHHFGIFLVGCFVAALLLFLALNSHHPGIDFISGNLSATRCPRALHMASKCEHRIHA